MNCQITDVIRIDKTNETFRLLYDAKGRYATHRITEQEGSFKLCKVVKKSVGPKGVPFIVTHDARTIRYPDPHIKVFYFVYFIMVRVNHQVRMPLFIKIDNRVLPELL